MTKQQKEMYMNRMKEILDAINYYEKLEDASFGRVKDDIISLTGELKGMVSTGKLFKIFDNGVAVRNSRNENKTFVAGNNMIPLI